MSEKGPQESIKISQHERITATDITLTGTTNDGPLFNLHMHEAGESKDKHERAKVWRTEEAMALEDDTLRCHADGRMLTDLPEACTGLIVSYMSPKDVARGACVCQGFRNTLDSDSVWEQLLPKSAMKLVIHNDELKSATKKKTYSFLCRPFLLSDTLAYWLDQSTGGVCHSLAARGLQIVWGDDGRYWAWEPRQGARWPEVTWLKSVCWFHITGKLKCILPPGPYTLSWRIQYRTRSGHGWEGLPVKFCVSTTDGSQTKTSHRYLLNQPEHAARQNELDDLTPVRLVDDGWLEFDAGEIIVVDEGKETSLEFSMLEIDSGEWKDGVILDGVMLRPTSLARSTGRRVSEEELGEMALQIEPPPVHVVGPPLGRLGGRGPIEGVFPIRRGRLRRVQPGPPQFDAAEEG